MTREQEDFIEQEMHDWVVKYDIMTAKAHCKEIERRLELGDCKYFCGYDNPCGKGIRDLDDCTCLVCEYYKSDNK